MRNDETLKTYVTSYTWDNATNSSFPDEEEVDRTIAEIDRLIEEGHTIKVILENNPIEMNRLLFTTILMPLFPDYVRRVVTTKEEFKNDVKETVASSTEPKEDKKDTPGPSNK